jgi:hypothetical protein
MGWRFRKSFSPLPGVRINLSPGGLSTSVGVGPFRFSAGPRGAAVNARIPGTGISFRQPLKSGARIEDRPVYRRPLNDWSPSPDSIHEALTLGEIRSAGTSELTSEGLAKFKELLTKAQVERRSLLPELQSAASESIKLKKKHDAWVNGWFLRRVFRRRFAQLKQRADEWKARHEELQEQEALSKLNTQFDLPDAVRRAFSQVSDAFAVMAKSQRVWDTVAAIPADRARERTSATTSIVRRRVTFNLGVCDLIQSEWKVPHLANANGGDLFIYPGFILFFISEDTFALIEASHVDAIFRSGPFIEEEEVPLDTHVVQQTWKKANKDGSPDRRFANNYQIPVVEYGNLMITSPTGLNEHYMISNAAAVADFSTRWAEFRQEVLRAVR